MLSNDDNMKWARLMLYDALTGVRGSKAYSPIVCITIIFGFCIIDSIFGPFYASIKIIRCKKSINFFVIQKILP